MKPLKERTAVETEYGDKLKEGAAQTVAEVKFVELNYKADNANFEGNLTGSQPEDLKKMAVLAKDGVTDGPIQVTGHTSDKATNYKSNKVSTDNNQLLSEDRAQNAKKYLVDKLGVPSTKVEAKGVGSTQPKTPNVKKNSANQRTDIKVNIIL